MVLTNNKKNGGGTKEIGGEVRGKDGKGREREPMTTLLVS